MADTDMTTTTERIRSAEETVARAQDALDKAQAGLRTAEKLSETVDEAKTHPLLVMLAIAMTAGLLAVVIAKLRSGDDG